MSDIRDLNTQLFDQITNNTFTDLLVRIHANFKSYEDAEFQYSREKTLSNLIVKKFTWLRLKKSINEIKL